MAKIKEKWWGVLGGRADAVMRHVEIPVRLNNDPDREVVIIVPASKIPQFMRTLANAHARATGTSALMASLESSDGGDTGPDGN